MNTQELSENPIIQKIKDQVEADVAAYVQDMDATMKRMESSGEQISPEENQKRVEGIMEYIITSRYALDVSPEDFFKGFADKETSLETLVPDMLEGLGMGMIAMIFQPQMRLMSYMQEISGLGAQLSEGKTLQDLYEKEVLVSPTDPTKYIVYFYGKDTDSEELETLKDLEGKVAPEAIATLKKMITTKLTFIYQVDNDQATFAPPVSTCPSCKTEQKTKDVPENNEAVIATKDKKPSTLRIITLVVVFVVAVVLGRLLGVVVVLFIAAWALGEWFPKWYMKRKKVNKKLVAWIVWSNVVTWLLPPLGVLTGFAALTFAEYFPDTRKKYKIVAYVAIALAILNAISGILLGL